MNTAYKKILLPSRPHPDTILAIFILKKFGKEKYPNIENAEIEIWQELPKNETTDSLNTKGVLVLDLGEGKFDHHKKGVTLSRLIAEDLEVSDDKALSKILIYGERDDKFGLGTISTDPIDKAFGLSGLTVALNKALPQDYQKVINLILTLIHAHYLEERKKTEELPQEFEEKLKNGQAEIFELKQDKKKLKIIAIESDNLSMASWLKSSEGQKADLVCQRMTSGYTNILTKPLKRVDLRWLAAYLRNEEANLCGKKLRYSTFELMRPGKISEIPQWYYDRATNSILNGGTNPNGILPTAIPFEKIKEIAKEALSQDTPGK